MSGSTPYAVRSPSQSNQYPPPFSPTHQTRPFFGHEPFSIPPPQHLVQTPTFPPASLIHSPLHNRPTLASPLPTATALPPPPPLPLGAGSHYQPLPSSPPFAHQRQYSGHLIHPPMATVYDVHPSHAHPASSVLQSPIREHHNLTNGRPSEMSSSESRPQSKDVSTHVRSVRKKTDLTLQRPERSSNPMSFASILGPSNNEPSPRLSEAKQPPPRPATPPSKLVEESKPLPDVTPKQTEIGSIQLFVNGDLKPQPRKESVQVQRKRAPTPPPRTKGTKEELEKISQALNAVDEITFSDVEDPGWAEQMQHYKQRSRKRAAVIHDGESHKRKVGTQFCRTQAYD